ncbi:hypothetical protein DICSQDRAFT_123958 [Dichomitus squalens LYAD-421 SS1]|uniref:uncharacterized protein n=1 Tax=Dichomitus squalens (strain LYAD-421) TaxID=732165 RepID=UPI000441384F|nr:uncharacterized protein DICSQDRAFT_123958 [Dichomitus squalens LYAD-421 SS1]EJF65815.1 hypothetical protein DICSQDRAFT_123958 [Dichomitus squalens LYAD-421 SS1]
MTWQVVMSCTPEATLREPQNSTTERAFSSVSMGYSAIPAAEASSPTIVPDCSWNFRPRPTSGLAASLYTEPRARARLPQFEVDTTFSRCKGRLLRTHITEDAIASRYQSDGDMQAIKLKPETDPDGIISILNSLHLNELALLTVFIDFEMSKVAALRGFLGMESRDSWLCSWVQEGRITQLQFDMIRAGMQRGSYDRS